MSDASPSSATVESRHVENPDIVLIGSGIMSATLGAIAKQLDPSLRIQMYEVTSELSQESSNGWNNAGTGHAGLCELSYTPYMNDDGTVPIDNALDIFEQFEQSLQFWAYAADRGMLGDVEDCVRPVPHVSFVHGEEQVRFLRARYEGLAGHHFFSSMEYRDTPEGIREWAPLLVDGREDMPIAATRVESGTDVNFGAIAQRFGQWLNEQEGCGVATSCRVTDLKQTDDGWRLTIKDLANDTTRTTETPFVFVGAGGASLTLLQKSGIPEGRGYGGFPVGGQWLVCDKPDLVLAHHAKVYGQAQAEAPTMAVPHLDQRVIDGKPALLFGPFASWTTKFLHRHGSVTDLPFSIRPDNFFTLIKTGLYNLGLVKYLMKEGMQSKASRVQLLRGFYPEARDEDWRVVDAGIRVQAIKDTAGIVHYGTEVITDERKSISALLGASPGASVSVYVMMKVIESALPQLLDSEHLSEVVATWGVDLKAPEAADRFRELSSSALSRLGVSAPAIAN